MKFNNILPFFYRTINTANYNTANNSRYLSNCVADILTYQSMPIVMVRSLIKMLLLFLLFYITIPESSLFTAMRFDVEMAFVF